MLKQIFTTHYSENPECRPYGPWVTSHNGPTTGSIERNEFVLLCAGITRLQNDQLFDLELLPLVFLTEPKCTHSSEVGKTKQSKGVHDFIAWGAMCRDY